MSDFVRGWLRVWSVFTVRSSAERAGVVAAIVVCALIVLAMMEGMTWLTRH